MVFLNTIFLGLEKRGTKKKTTNTAKETTLKEEGVQQLRSLRLPLLSASTSSNGSWEDLFRTFDLDCDGVVSEIDFALSILPYDHRMISLGHLHDFFLILLQNILGVVVEAKC